MNVSGFHKARYDSWVKMIGVGVPAATLTWSLAFITIGEWTSAWVTLCVFLFTSAMIWSVFPRGYLITPSGIRVVLGWPWKLDLPFSTINEIRPARSISALVYWGWRFAPSAATPVEIRRLRHRNLVISPEDREAFIEAAQRALDGFNTSQ